MMDLSPRSLRRRQHPHGRAVLRPVAAIVEGLEPRQLLSGTVIGGDGQYIPAGNVHNFHISTSYTATLQDGTVVTADKNGVIQIPAGQKTVKLTLSGSVDGPPGVAFPHAVDNSPTGNGVRVRVQGFTAATDYSFNANPPTNNPPATKTSSANIAFTLTLNAVPVGTNPLVYEVSDNNTFVNAPNQPPHLAVVTGFTNSVTVDDRPSAPALNLTVHKFKPATKVDITGNTSLDADEKNSQLTFASTSNPTKALAFSLHADGTLDYTPRTDIPAPYTDTFDYSVNDGVTTPSTGTVTITVINDPPSIITSTAVVQNVQTPQVIQPTGLRVADDDNSDAQLTYTLKGVPSDGVLLKGTQPLKAGDTFTQDDVDNQLIKYQRNANASTKAKDPVPFTVTDGDTTLNGTLVIQLGNGIDAPTINQLDAHAAPAYTNDNTPTFAGTGATPDSTIQIFAIDDNKDNPSDPNARSTPLTLVGTPTADLKGSWTAKVQGPIPDGKYSFYATSNQGGKASLNGPLFGPVTVVTGKPQLSSLTLQPVTNPNTNPADLITKVATPTLQGTLTDEFNAPVTVTVSRGNSILGRTPAPVAPGSAFPLTLTSPLSVGTNPLTVTATDAAGNSVQRPLSVVLDTAAPVVPDLRLTKADLRSGTGMDTAAFPVSVTTNPNPTIQFTVNDQSYASKANTLTIDATDGVGGPSLVHDTAQSIPPGSDGNASLPVSETLKTLGAGAHTIVLTVTDAAGNTLTENLSVYLASSVANSPAAPGTPVFTTVYDLSKIPALKTDTAQSPSIFPWTMSFDRNTQTVWVDLRGGDTQSATNGTIQSDGNAVLQLDPATNSYKVYSLNDAANDPALDGNSQAKTLLTQSGPHGIAFDLDSHITPRVWFTSMVKGLISYLDLTSPDQVKVVSYNLSDPGFNPLAKTPGFLSQPHAVVVDKLGDVWVSDHMNQAIYQIVPDPSGATSDATLIVHREPASVVGTTPGFDNATNGPHGMDVTIAANPVFDSKGNKIYDAGQPYLWFTQLATGHVVLLTPAFGTHTTDTWTDYAVSNGGYPLFPVIDTVETPDAPQDDSIYLSDPGVLGAPKHFIYKLDPNATTNPAAMTVPLTTWVVPTPPGGGATPQPNEVLVDREGHLFYIDRQYGVGRLDPLAPGSTTNIRYTPVNASALPPHPMTPLTATPSPYPAVAPQPLPLGTLQLAPGVSEVPSLNPPGARYVSTNQTEGVRDPASTVLTSKGFNQYSVVGGNSSGGRGFGPFRGTLSAGSVVYSSLTQNDEVTATVFAETARRSMAAVATADGSRFAFQTLRAGDLVVTWSGPGQLGSNQFDLTTTLPGPTLLGDPTALTAGNTVYAFARNAVGGLSEYTYDTTRPTAGWKLSVLNPPRDLNQTLPADPTAFTDSARGPGVMVTTSTGRLLVYYPGLSPDPIDVTPAGNPNAVYSSPGVVESNGQIYGYATDQKGHLYEFSYPVASTAPAAGSASARMVTLAPDQAAQGKTSYPQLAAFQDVTAVAVGGVRHVFVTDGNSQLIHVTAGPSGDTAQNVTYESANGLNGDPAPVGFNPPYERPFAGRVYPGVSAIVDPITGQIYVYGTNGHDMVEFHQLASGAWQVTDLTGNVSSSADHPTTANRVFGAPAAYADPSGSRHIFQINENGEVIQYYQLSPGAPYSTVNNTLIIGNSSGTVPAILPPGNPPPPAQDAPSPAIVYDNNTNTYSPGFGTLTTAADSATFPITPYATGYYTINLQPLSKQHVPVLNIYDAKGHRIATNVASKTLASGLVTVTLSATQRYNLVVRARFQSLGNFKLTVTSSSSPAVGLPTPSAASTTPHRALSSRWKFKPARPVTTHKP